MSKKQKWHSGPPPSLGWWPASVRQDAFVYRWWNGLYWSEATLKSYHPISVKKAANNKSGCQTEIQWCARPASWPARSRT